MPCFPIVFANSSPLDMHGKIQLEPHPITLSIFKEETHHHPEAWHTLYYIHNKNTQVAEVEELDVEDDEDMGSVEPYQAQPDINHNLQDSRPEPPLPESNSGL